MPVNKGFTGYVDYFTQCYIYERVTEVSTVSPRSEPTERKAAKHPPGCAILTGALAPAGVGKKTPTG